MAELNIKEHFQVPEGYFDNLTEQVMKSLPEQPFQIMHIEPAETKMTAKKHRIIPMWSRYTAAACVAGIVMVSAFTTFYSGADKTEQKQSPIAAVTTTIADSSKKVVEAIAPTPVKEHPVLAKAETTVHKTSNIKSDVATIREKNSGTKPKSYSQHQNYDMNVNTGYDQSDVERAAVYMGIDNQDISEMMYEDL